MIFKKGFVSFFWYKDDELEAAQQGTSVRLSSVAKFTEDSKVMTHFFIFDDGEALYDWLLGILRLITIFQGAQEGRESFGA